MSCIIRIVIVLFLSGASAFAGRGGHVTTWDPNLEGGGWVCFQSQVAGCSKGYNATCNGVADDTAAQDAFVADAIAGNLAAAKLYIPPGAKCTCTAGSFNVPSTFTQGGAGVKNLLVWGYGATTCYMNILGGGAFYIDSGATSALIQQANIGDTSVTLVNAGDAAIFSVGDWIAITGDEMMTFGQPQNFAFAEFKLITAKNGSILSLGSGPLKNQYLTTWPNLGVVTGVNLAGPATIFKMQPSWNTNSTYLGIHVNNVPPTGINLVGRSIKLYDVTLNGAGYGPSASKEIWTFFTPLYSTEFDKEIEFMYNYRASGHQMIFQSGSDNSVTFDSSAIDIFNGTTKNLVVKNSTIGAATGVGPTGFGIGANITLDGTTVGSAACSAVMIDTSALTFSAGTFSLPNNSASISNAYATFVPGHKYYAGDSDGTNNASPGLNFTVTGITQDATDTHIATDISSLPSTMCNTHTPCPKYVAWQVMSLSQKFSSAPGLSTCVAP